MYFKSIKIYAAFERLTFSITGYNFNFIHFSHFLNFPKLDIIQHECPNIITKPVGVQFSSLQIEYKTQLKFKLRRTTGNHAKSAIKALTLP